MDWQALTLSLQLAAATLLIGITFQQSHSLRV